MKKKMIIHFVFVFLCAGHSFSQTCKNHINFILHIDDELIINGVSKGCIEILNGEKIIRRVNFEYNVGEISMSKEDYEFFTALKPDTEIMFKFVYRKILPEVSENLYSKKTTADWLNQRYVIFKVYNFENKKNKNKFREKTGYGIEMQIPARKSSIPLR